MFKPILTGLLDFLLIVACAYLAHWMRFDNFFQDPDYNSVIPVGALVFTVCATMFGVYGSQDRFVTRAGKLFLSWGATISLVLVYLVFSKTSELHSRLWLGYWIVCGFTAIVSLRLVSHGLRRLHFSNPKNRKRILLVGDSTIALSIASDERSLNANGFTISGFYRTKGPTEAQLDGLLLVQRDSISDFVMKTAIAEVWICLHLKDEEYVNKIIYELRHSTVNIRQILKTQDLNVLAKPTSEFRGIHTLDLSCSPHHGGKLLAKNVEDYILGSMIFVTLVPVLAAIALAVKVSSPGPILFKQHRHGVDGRKFKVYKFRTMQVHEESDGSVTQATKNDPRVTKVGKFLRRTSLDELPQFYNVLQGRMSIVGPRPHALAHNTYYSDLIDSYMRRHMVKPGITGWAQVNGFRGETDSVDKMKARVDYDLYYIENWSIWLDLKIISLTPVKLFFQENAY